VSWCCLTDLPRRKSAWTCSYGDWRKLCTTLSAILENLVLKQSSFQL